MQDKNPPKKSQELLRSITRLSVEADWSEAELRDVLVEAGVDPDVLVGRVLSDVRTYLRRSPFHWRNIARDKRSQLLTRITEAAAGIGCELTREELLRRIKAKLSQLPQPVSAQFALEFRGFQECSREDLVSMLAELEVLGDLERENHGP